MNFDAGQRAEMVLKLYETTKEKIESMNVKYKFAGSKGKKHVTFELGNLVWLQLRKDRFPDLRKSKLLPRADGPFKVLAPHLTLQIRNLIWEKKMNSSQGRLKYKKGRMMRISLSLVQPRLLHSKDQLLEHEHDN
jgi:hypothetical protein